VPGKHFSAELQAVIAKAVAKQREDRHETTIDFAQALRACLKDPLASTAARRALPSTAAPSAQSSSGRPSGRAASRTLTEIDTAPTVPVSRGPLIAIAAAAAVVLLILGVWLGSLMSK
jgi:hypothetical protein